MKGSSPACSGEHPSIADEGRAILGSSPRLRGTRKSPSCWCKPFSGRACCPRTARMGVVHAIADRSFCLPPTARREFGAATASSFSLCPFAADARKRRAASLVSMRVPALVLSHSLAIVTAGAIRRAASGHLVRRLASIAALQPWIARKGQRRRHQYTAPRRCTC